MAAVLVALALAFTVLLYYVYRLEDRVSVLERKLTRMKNERQMYLEPTVSRFDRLRQDR